MHRQNPEDFLAPELESLILGEKRDPWPDGTLLPSYSGPSASEEVLHVSKARRPLKIVESIVALVKIQVVRFLSRQWIPQECAEDEPVDRETPHARAIEQLNTWIPSTPKQRAQDFLSLEIRPLWRLVAKPAKRLDPAEVGHLVDTYVADDGKPDFWGRIFGSHSTLLGSRWSEPSWRAKRQGGSICLWSLA